jgi:hypothetical protein
MTTALPPVVQRALDAANAHDLDAFLACFAPGGSVDDWGRVFTGPEAITGWSDKEFIGVGVTLRVTGATGTPDRTTVEADVGGEGYNGPSHFTFIVSGEGIERMEIRA